MVALLPILKILLKDERINSNSIDDAILYYSDIRNEDLVFYLIKDKRGNSEIWLNEVTNLMLKTGHIEAIKFLIKEFKIKIGVQEVIKALKRRHVELVKMLLDDNVIVNNIENYL